MSGSLLPVVSALCPALWSAAGNPRVANGPRGFFFGFYFYFPYFGRPLRAGQGMKV
ncbi:MAG: hypothetical protein N2383_06510 [Caldilineales bacterium]|nr:hypothetical protein [Caldilineales bacterium]